jgi:primosomal protein N' (replication factor Y)
MKDVTEQASHFFANAMKPKYGQYIVGPAEPIVNRVRNQYLMELLVKLPKDSTLVKECKQFMLDQISVLHSDKRFKSVVVIPDVDK